MGNENTFLILAWRGKGKERKSWEAGRLESWEARMRERGKGKVGSGQ
jgi:hypothetical protein